MLGPAYCVRNFGVGGTTMLKAGDNPYWNTAQFSQALQFAPNFVFIMLGTNDAKDINWQTHYLSYEPDYLAMVYTFKNLANTPWVSAVTPPPAYAPAVWTPPGPYVFNPNVINSQIPPIIQRIAHTTGQASVDVWHVFGAHCPDVNQRCDWMSPDGIHPNDAGYQQVANLVKQTIVFEPGLRYSVLRDGIELPGLARSGNLVVPAVLLIGMPAFGIAAMWRARARFPASASVDNYLSSE